MFLIIAFVTLGILIYLLNQHHHSFWEKLGFPQLKPKFLVGNLGSMLTMKVSIGEFLQRLYTDNKHINALGFYMAYQPALLVNDPMLLQKVMITAFSSFHDRPVPFDLEHDKLQAHLFHVPGQKWRDLRVKLSPTFTSGKLKGMFPIIKSCGLVLDEYVRKNFAQGVDEHDFRELMARYNTNIISSVAFGIENDCINEPDHIFRRMGARNFETNWRTDLRNMLAFFAPKIMKYISFKITDPEVEVFMYSIVKQTMEYRKKNNVERNDFLQQLIQLHEKGYVSVDKNDKSEHVEQDIKKLSFDDLVANVFVFFQAGYETSSSTMSFCLYELAKNPEAQRKVHEEIDRVMKSAGDEGITYDKLSELKYLECCIDEALRKYPIVPLLFRVCTEEYKIPDTELTIPKGAAVMIPVLGYHRDPEIFENPMEFRPERFLNSSNGAPNVKGLFYMPFGDGPRNCIGLRLGMLTAKLALSLVLSKYSIELADKTMADKELAIHPKQFILQPAKDFKLKIVPRDAQ